MYTIKQASIRSGVSIPLLRAWERRYGIPTPERTASGYRLYGDEALAQLRAMRRLVDDGWAPSQAAVEVLAGRADDSSDRSRRREADRVDTTGERTPLVDRIVEAARNLDAARLEAALGDAALAADFETAVAEVWLPAMVAVGDAWAAGDLDVASEHAVSAALLARLGAAFEAAGRADGRPDIVVGLPPGGRHELGALAFAVAGRRSGIGILYLGADVPATSWVRAVEETGARAAVVGIVTEDDARSAGDVVAALAAARPATAVFVGGPATRRGNAAGARLLPDDLPEAVDAVRQALHTAS